MRRTKFEICLAVLKALSTSERPVVITRLTIKAKVNYAVLKPILDDMVEKSLVERVTLKNGGVGFSVTLSGQEMLNQHKQSTQPTQGTSQETMINAVAYSWQALL